MVKSREETLNLIRYAQKFIWNEGEPARYKKYKKKLPPKSSQTRWITLNGDHEGPGTKVQIDGRGKIVKGPKALKRKTLRGLSYTNAKKRMSEAVREIRRKAKGDGHKFSQDDIKSAIESVWTEKKDHHETREQIKKDVREQIGLTQQDIDRLENAGKDYDSIRGFDVLASNVASENPELGLGTFEQGFHEDIAVHLWDMLREGKKPDLWSNDPEVIDEAYQRLVSSQPVYDDDIPFSEKPKGDYARYAQKLFDFMEWRTLGAQPGSDGKKHGGFKAEIDTRDGTIIKSKVKALEGKNVKDVKDHFDDQKKNGKAEQAKKKATSDAGLSIKKIKNGETYKDRDGKEKVRQGRQLFAVMDSDGKVVEWYERKHAAQSHIDREKRKESEQINEPKPTPKNKPESPDKRFQNFLANKADISKEDAEKLLKNLDAKGMIDRSKDGTIKLKDRSLLDKDKLREMVKDEEGKPSGTEPKQIQEKKGQSTKLAEKGESKEGGQKEANNRKVKDSQPETPREEAKQEAEKELEDDAEYAYARKSSIPNAGEDLLGSARHKVNEWRGLKEAEESGVAEKLVTRDKLLKLNPPNLVNAAESNNSLAAIAMWQLMKKFPKQPNYSTIPGEGKEEREKKERRDYVESYEKIKSEAERIAESTPDHKKALSEIRSVIVDQINKLREGDKYNRTANSLISTLLKASHPESFMTGASVARDMDKVGKHMVDLLKGESPGKESLDTLKDIALSLMEGKSLNAAMGKKGKGSGGAKFKPSDLYVNHATRKGGKEIPEELKKDSVKAVDHMVNHFGARGVQWGNSVTDDERKHHSTKLVEAFTDLADILGFKPEDVSLDGRMGFAIGARGKGSALAHYEPDTQVINLTRKKGVGSLAHEWGHAFDYMSDDFEKWKKGGSGIGLSERRTRHAVKADESMMDAYDSLRESWKNSGYEKRLRNALQDSLNNGGISEKMANYWLKKKEMFARSFETYIQNKLNQNGRSNTYLSGVMNHEFWPNSSEMESISKSFDSIFNAFRESKGYELKKYSREYLARYFETQLS